MGPDGQNLSVSFRNIWYWHPNPTALDGLKGVLCCPKPEDGAVPVQIGEIENLRPVRCLRCLQWTGNGPQVACRALRKRPSM